MNRGGHRGTHRGGGDRNFPGGSSSSYQPNGRNDGSRGQWGPQDGSGAGSSWSNRNAAGSTRCHGRGGGYGASSSGRCWGRDEGPGTSRHGGGGPPRGPHGSYGRRRGRADGPRCRTEHHAIEYSRGESVTMTEAPPVQKQGAPPFCQNFAFYGDCRFGSRCRFAHALECVGYQEEAHGGKGIRCCIVNPAASELFTGGKDKKLMRWQISQPAAQVSPGTAEGGDLDSTGEPLLALNCLTCTDMGAEVCCLKLLGGALFAGLGDGRIKVFLANGEVKELTGHEKSVYSLLLVEGVLVSGDWGGCIRFWRFEEPQQTFNAIHALQVEGSICCLQTADVTLPQPPGGATPPAAGSSAPPTTRKVLWAGGTALSIIDLQSLQVLRVLDVSDVKGNGPPLVLALLPFNDCLLVGFASGAICAYTADGERQYCFSSDYLSAMEGLMSPRGPVLVYGGRRSSFRVLKVPEFEERGSLAAHEAGDIKAVCALGPTHFVTCGDDGAIAIWKWALPHAETASKQ
ncbi:zinc finger CCCH domain-containing protein 17 [Cyclospora cayetanensis]|uniref:Zinc finger CCCH domain-containing protein 17 n=1 Tax=Cyclospora cayetanensis TaxID=88456 RepID=A0A6P6RQZ0_9EIME|nr:zinc finger CCCH domain-containing protein 17 [Cyclospora cayetanensis]